MGGTLLALDILERLLMAQVRVRSIIAQARAEGREVTDEEIKRINDETRILEDSLLEKFRKD